MKRLTPVGIAIAGVLVIATPVAAGPTIFVAPNSWSSVDPTLDVPWQAAVGGNFTEYDLDAYADYSDVDAFTAGPITVDVGLGGVNGVASTAEIFQGSYGGGGGSYGTVAGGAFLNRNSSGGEHSQITFGFSQPVRGFGLWVFDNSVGSADSFRMTLTESGGATATSGILESGNNH